MCKWNEWMKCANEMSEWNVQMKWEWKEWMEWWMERVNGTSEWNDWMERVNGMSKWNEWMEWAKGTREWNERMEWLNGMSERNEEMERVNGVSERNEGMDRANGTSEWNKWMERANGTTEWNERMERVNGTSEGNVWMEQVSEMSECLSCIYQENGMSVRGVYINSRPPWWWVSLVGWRHCRWAWIGWWRTRAARPASTRAAADCAATSALRSRGSGARGLLGCGLCLQVGGFITLVPTTIVYKVDRRPD